MSIITVIILLFAFAFSVSASEPTGSFVHEETASGKVVSVPSREMYSATRVVTADSLGLKNSMTGLSDLCCDKAGNVYLLSSDSSTVIVLKKDYSFIQALLKQPNYL